MNKPRHYRGGFEYSGSLTLTRKLRQTSTDAESHLWDRLRDRQLFGFKFRRQHQIGKYVVDFYCHKARLVIECDGGIHSSAQVWHHDQNREIYMSALGLRTVRFTNEDARSGSQTKRCCMRLNVCCARLAIIYARRSRALELKKSSR